MSLLTILTGHVLAAVHTVRVVCAAIAVEHTNWVRNTAYTRHCHPLHSRKFPFKPTPRLRAHVVAADFARPQEAAQPRPTARA